MQKFELKGFCMVVPLRKSHVIPSKTAFVVLNLTTVLVVKICYAKRSGTHKSKADTNINCFV